MRTDAEEIAGELAVRTPVKSKRNEWSGRCYPTLVAEPLPVDFANDVKACGHPASMRCRRGRIMTPLSCSLLLGMPRVFHHVNHKLVGARYASPTPGSIETL
jgi:hypothetical protein